MSSLSFLSTLFFFFNDTATTEIYTLSLHDALPISDPARILDGQWAVERVLAPQALEGLGIGTLPHGGARSEEHTSELQSRSDLVCRLLLEKKKKQASVYTHARNISTIRHQSVPRCD